MPLKNNGLPKRTRILIILFGLFIWSLYFLLRSVSAQNNFLSYVAIVSSVVCIVFFILIFFKIFCKIVYQNQTDTPSGIGFNKKCFHCF